MMRGLVTRIKRTRRSHLLFNALFYTRQFQLYILYEGPKGFATQFLLIVTANINIRVWRYSPGINIDTPETGC